MDNRLNEIISLKEWDVELMNLLSIQRMIEKFPYCALLYVRAARYSRILNCQNAEQYKQMAAAYVSDRTFLKEFLEREIPVNPSISAEKTKQTDDKDILKEIDRYTEPDLSENPTREELIERFLNIENPKIGKTDADKCENDDKKEIDKIIKESVSDDFKMVTETMAKIYLKQGNKSKALKIYRQLMLNNPKKSVYFADRIKEIENNLNN